jgi:carbon storage regulator
MLVIRRKTGESLLIGDAIEIEVIELSPSRVKLGIRAPREVLILRKELLAVGKENQRAALSLEQGALAAVLATLGERPARAPEATAPVVPHHPVRPLR